MYLYSHITKKISTILFLIFLLFITSRIPTNALLNDPIFNQDQIQKTSLRKQGLKIFKSKGFILSNIAGTDILIYSPQPLESSIYDLKLSFDNDDYINNYNIIRAKFETNNIQKSQGSSSAKFISGNDSIILFPNEKSILYHTQGSGLQSFTIEFSLYTYFIGEGKQTIVSYIGSDIDNPDDPNHYGFSITIEEGVIHYNFINLFQDKQQKLYNFTLKEKNPLITQKWETHTVAIDTANQTIKIYRNGKENQVQLITQDQTTTGNILSLPNVFIRNQYISPLTIGENALFSLDNFVIYRNIYTDYNRYVPNQKNYIETEVFSISTNYSWLSKMNIKSPSTNMHYKLAYRFATNYFFPETKTSKLPWVYINPSKNKFPPSQSMGKYIQWRLEYFTPIIPPEKPFLIQDILVNFRENPDPSGIKINSIIAGDGTIDIQWNSIPDNSIISYEIFYGNKPNNYFGTTSISPASPITIPHPSSEKAIPLNYKLKGLDNEKAYYIAIRIKDKYGIYSEFSPEQTAIPSSIKNKATYSIGR